jgi:pentatricopeptide repeat protein
VIKGFVAAGSLASALEVFNTFCESGGTPDAFTYNILMDGFGRQGQLLNCESLIAQMRRQPGLAPDTYTYNALLRAAATADRPRRALAHYRLMQSFGVRADATTLTLLVAVQCALDRPLAAVQTARETLEASSLEELPVDLPLLVGILRACADSSYGEDAQPGVAREQSLWFLSRMRAQAEAHRNRRASSPPKGESGVDGAYVSDELFAPIVAKPLAIRDLIRTLGNAGDFENARRAFELSPSPRPQIIWSEMIRVCNLCGEVSMASEILASM